MGKGRARPKCQLPSGQHYCGKHLLLQGQARHIKARTPAKAKKWLARTRPEHLTCTHIPRAPFELPGHHQCQPFSGLPPSTTELRGAGRPPPVLRGRLSLPLTSLAAAAAEGPGAGSGRSARPGRARSSSSSGRPRASGPGASARPQRPCARPCLALRAAASCRGGRAGRAARAPAASPCSGPRAG